LMLKPKRGDARIHATHLKVVLRETRVWSSLTKNAPIGARPTTAQPHRCTVRQNEPDMFLLFEGVH
jgi:hypothetical protein